MAGGTAYVKVCWNLYCTEINLINPDSDEGKKIVEKNPEMDVSQKVLINVRVLGYVDTNLSFDDFRFVKITNSVLKEIANSASVHFYVLNNMNNVRRWFVYIDKKNTLQVNSSTTV